MKKLLFALILALQVLSAQGIQSSEQLIEAMRDRYAGKWYSTLTFVQKTSQIRPDTTIVSTWHEAFVFPGKMRIDMDSTQGMVIVGDSVYVIRDGKLSATRYFVHTLLILGFDVYFSTPQETMAKLQGLKFDLTQFREDTWEGRPVYVVGGKAGDFHSRQFWIDKERLYFVRLLEPAGADGKSTRETQFNKYVRLGNGWLAPEVIFMVDKKVLMKEEYSDSRANPKLDLKIFDPQLWSSTRWW